MYEESKNNADMWFDYFRIRSSVIPTEQYDLKRQTNAKKIKFVVSPYRVHAYSLSIPGVSTGQNFKSFVYKTYNYIFTGDNVDVQNLRINYKTAYYLRNVRGDDQSGTEKGWLSEFFQGFKEIFGQERDPEPLLPLRQYPSAIMGGNTVSTNSGTEKKAQQFYDYLTHPEVDMMKIELDILGDPDYARTCTCPYAETGKITVRIVPLILALAVLPQTGTSPL